MTRKSLIAVLLLWPWPGAAAQEPPGQEAFDWPAMISAWKRRIGCLQGQGVLPIFDVESSYGQRSGTPGEWEANVLSLNDEVERLGVAVIAFEAGKRCYPEWAASTEGRPPWSRANHRLLGRGLPWFMPVPPGGFPMPQDGPHHLENLFREVLRDGYPLMGEFFFRRYPGDRSYQDAAVRDSHMSMPLDSPEAEAVFSFGEEHGLPFMMHLEVEDDLLPELERALARHPRAKVIWCHFGRVRYPERGGKYTPAWVSSMLARFPNLYFDVSHTGRLSRYPGSGALASVLWRPGRRRLAPEWKAVIEGRPWRFLAALDLGNDSMGKDSLSQEVEELRSLLGELSPETARIVAFGAAWRLIFHEDAVGPQRACSSSAISAPAKPR